MGEKGDCEILAHNYAILSCNFDFIYCYQKWKTKRQEEKWVYKKKHFFIL